MLSLTMQGSSRNSRTASKEAGASSAPPEHMDQDSEADATLAKTADRRGTMGIGVGRPPRCPTPPPNRSSISEDAPPMETNRRTGRADRRTQELQSKRSITRSGVSRTANKSQSVARSTSVKSLVSETPTAAPTVPISPTGRNTISSYTKKKSTKKNVQVKIVDPKEEEKSAEERARDVTVIRAAMSHTRQALTNMKASEDGAKPTFQKVAQVIHKNLRKLNMGKRLFTKSANDADDPQSSTEPVDPELMASILMDSIEHAFDDNSSDLLGDLNSVMRPFQDALKNWEGPDYATRRGAILNFSDKVEIHEYDNAKYDETYLSLVKDINDSVQKCEAAKAHLLKSLEELEALKIDMLAVPTIKLRATITGEEDRPELSDFIHRPSALGQIKEDQLAKLAIKEDDSDSDHFGSDSSEEDKKVEKPPARSMPGSRRISLAVGDDPLKRGPLRRLSTQKLELNIADLNVGESQPPSRRSSMLQANSRRSSFILQTEQRSMSRRTSLRSVAPSTRVSGVGGGLNLQSFAPPGLSNLAANFKTFDFGDASRLDNSAEGEEGRYGSPRPEEDEEKAKAKKIANALRGVRTALKTFQKNNSALKTLITTASQASRNPSRASSPTSAPSMEVPESTQKDQSEKRLTLSEGVKGVAKLRLKASIVGKLARWNPSATFQDRITTVVEALPEDVKHSIVEEEPDGAELTETLEVPTAPPPRVVTPAPDTMTRNKPDTSADRKASFSSEHRAGMDIKGINVPVAEDSDTLDEAEASQTQDKEGDLQSLLGRHSAEYSKDSLPESVLAHRRASPKYQKRFSSLKPKEQLPKENLPKWLTQEAVETLEVRNEANKQSGRWDLSGKTLRKTPLQSQKSQKSIENSLSFGDLSAPLNEVLPAGSPATPRKESVMPGLRRQSSMVRSLKSPSAFGAEVGNLRKSPTNQLSDALDQLTPTSSRESLFTASPKPQRAAPISRIPIQESMTKGIDEELGGGGEEQAPAKMSIAVPDGPIFAGAGLMQDFSADNQATVRRSSALPSGPAFLGAVQGRQSDVPERPRSRLRPFGPAEGMAVWKPIDGRQADATEGDSGLMIGENAADNSGVERRKSGGELRRPSMMKSLTREMQEDEKEGMESGSALMVGAHSTEDSGADAKRPPLDKRGSLSQLGALSRGSMTALAKPESNSGGQRNSKAASASRRSLETTNDSKVTHERKAAHDKSQTISKEDLKRDLPRSRSASSSATSSYEPDPNSRRSLSSSRSKRSPSPTPSRPSYVRRTPGMPKPTSRTGFAECPSEYFVSLSSKQALEEERRPVTAPLPESLKPVEAPRLPWTAPTKSVMPRLSTPRRADRRRAPPLSKLLSHVAKPTRMDVIADEFNPLAKLCHKQGTPSMGNTGGVHKTHLALMAQAGGSNSALRASRRANKWMHSRDVSQFASGTMATKAFARRGQVELHMWNWELCDLNEDDIGSLVPAIPLVPDLPEEEDLMVRDPLLYMVISEALNAV